MSESKKIVNFFQQSKEIQKEALIARNDGKINNNDYQAILRQLIKNLTMLEQFIKSS
jgi:hypothetical protein